MKKFLLIIIGLLVVFSFVNYIRVVRFQSNIDIKFQSQPTDLLVNQLARYIEIKPSIMTFDYEVHRDNLLRIRITSRDRIRLENIKLKLLNTPQIKRDLLQKGFECDAKIRLHLLDEINQSVCDYNSSIRLMGGYEVRNITIEPIKQSKPRFFLSFGLIVLSFFLMRLALSFKKK